ncbi:MAG: DsrE family protein [Betaproteobacteria bacterium]|nr:DsrE family protein [Betaproteobacteria bacterium]
MKALFILNDGPYGSERSYNGLRLARSAANKEAEVKVFLIGDAAACAKSGQKVPQGYYNIGVMLGAVIRRTAEVGVCGTCMDARGIKDEDLVEGSHRSSMEQLTDWTLWADKVMVF